MPVTTWGGMNQKRHTGVRKAVTTASRVNRRTESDWADRGLVRADGRPLNACTCGKPIRTHVNLCAECQENVNAFWRALRADLRAERLRREVA